MIWFGWVHSISTLIGYLMPKPVIYDVQANS